MVVCLLILRSTPTTTYIFLFSASGYLDNFSCMLSFFFCFVFFWALVKYYMVFQLWACHNFRNKSVLMVALWSTYQIFIISSLSHLVYVLFEVKFGVLKTKMSNDIKIWIIRIIGNWINSKEAHEALSAYQNNSSCLKKEVFFSPCSMSLLCSISINL